MDDSHLAVVVIVITSGSIVAIIISASSGHEVSVALGHAVLADGHNVVQVLLGDVAAPLIVVPTALASFAFPLPVDNILSQLLLYKSDVITILILLVVNLLLCS